MHRLEIVKRWRPRLFERSDLRDDERAAIDHLSLSLAMARLRCGRGLDSVVNEVDVANMRRMGIAPRSWRVFERAGVRLGVRLSRYCERARGRIDGKLVAVLNEARQ